MKNYCSKRFVAFILGLILAFSMFPVHIIAFEVGSDGVLSGDEFFSASSWLISENWDDDFVESISPAKYNPASSLLEAGIGSRPIFSVVENVENFEDIQELSEEMQMAIRVLASQNIVFGTERNRFDPEAPLSRAEIAAITVRMLDRLDPIDVSRFHFRFNDVQPNDWFYEAVGSAYGRGIMQGDGRYFYPSLTITRNQLASVAARILRNEMGYHTPSNPNHYLSRFIDRNDIESWSVEDISLATWAGIVTPRADGRFHPNATVTRGEAALMLYRMYQRLW